MSCEFLLQCHHYFLMPSFEEVCIKLLRRPGWAPKVLLGGALSFLPVLNLFSLGYLLHYTIRLNRTSDWNLPDWSESNALDLFKSGLNLFILLIFYVGIPIAVGLLLSIIINGITFGVFGILIYFPTAVGAFVAPFLFLASVQAYIRDGLLRDAFQLNLVVKISKAMGVNLILPVVSFWGILLLALPLYGFSFFLGTWILLAYSSALNFSINNKK